MAYSTLVTAFAQSVYRRIKNRQFDDITSADGQTFIANVIDFLNGYIDEYETTVDQFGNPVPWKCMRTNDQNLGTATLGVTSVALVPTGIVDVIGTPKRPLYVKVGSTIVSKWIVVKPSQLDTSISEKRVTLLNNVLYFNQAFTAAEDTGTIYADTMTSIPRVVVGDGTDDNVFSMITPRELLVLGVAKNEALPDIVQGGLAPSFVQKYNDLLTAAIFQNNDTTISDTVDREDFSFVKGIGF